MNRTTKIVGFSVPPAVAREVERLARQERRTKSELFREMVRVYRRYRNHRDRDEDRWIMGIIEEVKAEQERNPLSTEDMLKESDRLSHHGAQQAKRLGIKPKDIHRVVHDYRTRKQA